MKLEVLISTFGHDGIRRVVGMDLPRVEGVGYVVSWQLPGECPATVPCELVRNDVKVCQIDSRGLSVNRNNAIRQSAADVCLVADDDLRYTPDMLQAVIDTFENNPDVDVATFRYAGSEKWYAVHEFDLDKPVKGYYPSSVEIAFRRDRVSGKVEFNEAMGLGTPLLHSGEEAVFLHQALCRGLKCRYFPVIVAHHEGVSTGFGKLSESVLMGQGACFSVIYPVSGVLRLPLFAWRAYRRGQTRLFPAMWHLFRGYMYGKRNFNPDGTVK